MVFGLDLGPLCWLVVGLCKVDGLCPFYLSKINLSKKKLLINLGISLLREFLYSKSIELMVHCLYSEFSFSFAKLFLYFFFAIGCGFHYLD